MPFSRENGAELLGRSFSRVEARHATDRVTIRDDDAIWAYLRLDVACGPRRDAARADELPLRVHARTVVFVATR